MKTLICALAPLLIIAILPSIGITSSISQIKSSISKNEAEQAKLQSELKSAETSIGSLSKSIKQTDSDIKSSKKRLKILQNKLIKHQSELNQQRDFFAEQLRANYILAKQGQWNIYLKSNSTNDTQRYLMYYQAVNKAQLAIIQQMQATIKQLKSTAQDIQDNTNHLQDLYKKLKQQQKNANAQQSQRQSVLNKIKTSIKSEQKQLQTLQTNQNNLSHLVKHLNTSNATGKFSDMKRKLPWPITGRITNYFGTRVTNSSLTWKGNLIAAKQGTPIHAIFNGKVIYADWLRGYGLLIIIDHGHGFMSLYGRNHSLYKKVGDTISMGDIIGTVGRSGGFQTPALYFELRHKGALLNPKYWMDGKRPKTQK